MRESESERKREEMEVFVERKKKSYEEYEEIGEWRRKRNCW